MSNMAMTMAGDPRTKGLIQAVYAAIGVEPLLVLGLSLQSFSQYVSNTAALCHRDHLELNCRWQPVMSCQPGQRQVHFGRTDGTRTT